MLLNFTPEQMADPAIADSAEELGSCLQCGHCLTVCPTHHILSDEFDSPRGRILLIKEMLENGGKPDAKTVEHIDRCLSCLACLSSCPSRVNYMHLVDNARVHIEKNYRRPPFDRLLRWSLAQILPHSGRLRMTLRGAQLAKSVAFALPRRIRAMVEFAPSKLPPPSVNDEPQVFPAIGKRKQRVALLTGCAQKALNTDINDATIRILRRHGCEVVIAQGAGCCGALTYHMGKSRESTDAASKNIRAWMKEIKGEGLDAIVINTSGCGTVVKDYGHIFRSDALAEEAETVSALAKDISEVLSGIELDFKVKPALRVAYHTTCSLQYAQRIRFTPKKLLKGAGFTVLEPRDSQTCCGAAGAYVLTQPEISVQLRERKVKALESVSPDVISAGNIGCMTQIGAGSKVPIVHTVELLDWATGGPVPRALDAVADRFEKEKIDV